MESIDIGPGQNPPPLPEESEDTPRAGKVRAGEKPQNTKQAEVLAAGQSFHGYIEHRNFPDKIYVCCDITQVEENKGTQKRMRGSWQAMGQSAVMTLELENDGTLEIKLFGPDEDEDPTLATGKYKKGAPRFSGTVTSEGNSDGKFDFKLGKGNPNPPLTEEEEAQGEEAEDWETTLKSKIIKHKNLQVEEREEKTEGGIKGKEKVDEGGDKVKGTDTRDNANNERESSLVEALADVAHISAPMLFNYLSCRHRRVLILDVRSEDSRKKNGYVPRSVLLKVPESLPESLNVNIIQGMLPGRKEKMAFRFYRIYQTVVIGDSDQPGSIGHSIASTLHMRQIRGGVSQGNVFLLRGGFSEFKMLYPSLSDPDSKLLDEVKGPVKVGVNFLQPLDLPSEIINQYLFLGSHKDAERKSVLLTLGITHILIISKHRGKFNPYPETFEYARLGLAEGQDDGMLRATQFINAAQKNKPDGKKGDRILVAGITGNSAAASVVLAFMMKTGLMTLTEAFHELQNRRYSVCLSRPRWETLSRFEQSLLKKDTLEACIDLERAPPADAEEPVPEPRRDSKQLPPKTKGGSANESSDYHKGTRIRWGVNDYLQEKAERLVALVTALNTRYIGLKRENQQLQAQINSLRNSSMMGKKSPDQLSDTDTPASLRVELETLRTALKEYGSRLIRLGGIDGLAKV